jgi:glucose dehydrogenase
VWRTHLRGSGTGPQFSGAGQPIVYDGVAYVSTGANDVFALSIESGDILWQYSANLEATISSVCCGWNNKGVTISEDKVFIGQLDGKLVALDRATATSHGRFRRNAGRTTSRSHRLPSTSMASSSRVSPAPIAVLAAA